MFLSLELSPGRLAENQLGSLPLARPYGIIRRWKVPRENEYTKTGEVTQIGGYMYEEVEKK